MKIKSADTILINGRFLTMENEGEMAEAVAIENGRIVYVGNEEKARSFADRDTEIIDLGGRVAAPGLIDCHTHPMSSYAPRFSWLDLSGKNTSSLETLLNCLKDAAKKTPKGGWIVGRGYDESKFECHVMAGKHCQFEKFVDEDGQSTFGHMLVGFINRH